MNFLWGIAGIVVIFSIAFLFSENKQKINWRTIIGGFAIQVLFAFIVLKWEIGRNAFEWISSKVQILNTFASEGIAFVFGDLANANKSGFIFAFQSLSLIIFFSSLISVLYYLKIMQWIIRLIGGALSKMLGTSRAESMSAAANIFVGQTEAPLVVKPYIKKMTDSELFAVMTGGLASVAGSVMFSYAALGVPLKYLLAASFMSAPSGLIMAKMFIPETKVPETLKGVEMADDENAANVIDAAAKGASMGLSLALNVGAMLLAFVALIALLNGILGGFGSLFGFSGLSLELIFGYLFAPIAFVIGVPWDEAIQAGNFIGQKLILNEFVAYTNFAPVIDNLSEKTAAIISFALCGFANISSIAILIGGLGGMAPNRRQDIARAGVKAVLAGTLANLLSATLAGMFV